MSVASLKLRAEAGKLTLEGRSIITEVEKRDDKTITKEEETRFDKLHEDAEKKVNTAQRMELQDRADAGFAETPGEVRSVETGDKKTLDDSEKRAAAEAMFLSRGVEGMLLEMRATLQMDNDIGGGFISMSERFINKLLKDLDDRMVIRQLATVYKLNRGETLGIPSLDGDIGEYEWGAGELTEAQEDTGLALGKREFKPRDLQRKVIKISRALLENAKMNVEQLVIDRNNYALEVTLEKAFMTGDGAGKPLGLFVASGNGIPTSRDVNTGDALGFTGDGLIDIQDTLKDAYQRNARWLFHRNAVTLIRKLKDGDGQYLWNPGLQTGQPNVILGSPYIKAENVPNTYTNGLYAGMYGDFSWYWIADAIALSIQRLVEKYATTGQIGLLFDKMAIDGAPVKAEAFVRIKCAA